MLQGVRGLQSGNSEMNMVIRGARVVGPRSVLKADMAVKNGQIAAIGKIKPPKGAEVVDAKGLYALPGFVDMHTHGGAGLDATLGLYDKDRKEFDASESAFKRSLPRVMKRFARHGVTRSLLATLAAPEPQLEAALDHLGDYVLSEENGRKGARLEGVFVEGTFIMRPDYAGAQNPENFRKPDCRFFDRLNAAAHGTIRYVNVVPEYGRVSERLIRHVRDRGILAGLGHSSCRADKVRKCAKLGLRVAVHFLNGPTGLLFKPFQGGNVKEAVLRSRDIYAEIIGDGWHVAPAYIMDVVRRKGYDRVVAVTDTMFAAGAKGVREFTAGGVKGAVHETGEYLHTLHDPHTLFGSLLDMSTAFGNFLSWLTIDMEGVWYRRHPAHDLDSALVRVSRMCASNPAHLLAMDRPGGTGRLQKGRCADIVLASLSGKPGKWKVFVKRTFVGGRQVFGPSR